MLSSILALLLASAILLAAGVLLLKRRRHSARRLYQNKLESAMADGVLTADEMAELDRIRTEKDLTGAEVRMLARATYRRLLRDALRDARLSAEDDAALRHLQGQLGLSESDLGRDVTHLSRLRLFARVDAGDLPVVDSPLALVPNERCNWVVQCTLADELRLPRSPRSELHGTALVVANGSAFNAGHRRSALRPNDRILPTDLGILVVTSRRTVFQGAKRTLSIPHARLEHIVLHADGLRLDHVGGGDGVFLLVDDAELTAAILLQAARLRRAEIRPSRSGRSA